MTAGREGLVSGDIKGNVIGEGPGREWESDLVM